MNAYYATGFISALVLWVWPVYFFKNLEASAVVVAFFATLLFLAAGRMTSALHIRFIAPMAPPRGPGWAIALACATIVAIGLLTRLGYYLSMSAA